MKLYQITHWQRACSWLFRHYVGTRPRRLYIYLEVQAYRVWEKERANLEPLEES